ncbi:hypothetical protein PR202_gb14836 [Eleusine coracana subsp. coracana]|uniref:Uncharacterized protein n=1 Tax=Eleusine coracana subsp. coracana TaxID=191504 RepID=A0AAV5EW24_ELECO|nr:hypothetical protein PR202_gb14836 [Eleusine coracana subsp. coracana]
MPPPDKPCSFGTAGLTADEIAEIDPDYLYFLRHVRPDGQSYAVEIPSKDGSSPPRVVRYEKPLAVLNAAPSAAISEGRTRGASSLMEEGSSAAVDAPSGAASPSAGPDCESRGGAVPVEGDGLLSPKAEEPAWYDSMPDIDPDYRIFLQHARVVNDSQWVFKMGNFSMTLGEAPSVGNCGGDDEDEDEEDEEDGVEEVQIVSASRDISARTEEEDDVEEEKPVVVGSNWPVVKVSEIETKVKEEVEDAVKNEESQGMDISGSDLQLVNVLEFEMKVEVDEEEQSLNKPEPSKGSKLKTGTFCHASQCFGENFLYMFSYYEVEGVIWPTHIIERPESDFKRKLMKVLIKPFNQEEYDELFAMATDRTPVIKERRTRRRVMYYPWKHEMGKSYFDSYPAIVIQKGKQAVLHW